MGFTLEQALELERVAKDYKVEKDLLVCAISHLGIDVVLNCIDACDYDWLYNDGLIQPNCSYKGKLLLTLMDNGFDCSAWC